jgi:hypothetical protein
VICNKHITRNFLAADSESLGGSDAAQGLREVGSRSDVVVVAVPVPERVDARAASEEEAV